MSAKRKMVASFQKKHEEVIVRQQMTKVLWQKARQFSKLAKIMKCLNDRKALYRQKHLLMNLAIEKSPEIIVLLNNKTPYWAFHCEGQGILHLDPSDLSDGALYQLQMSKAS